MWIHPGLTKWQTKIPVFSAFHVAQITHVNQMNANKPPQKNENGDPLKVVNDYVMQSHAAFTGSLITLVTIIRVTTGCGPNSMAVTMEFAVTCAWLSAVSSAFHGQNRRCGCAHAVTESCLWQKGEGLFIQDQETAGTFFLYIYLCYRNEQEHTLVTFFEDVTLVTLHLL